MLILTGTRAVLEVKMPLHERIAKIKLLRDTALKLVVDSMAALASILALKAALGRLSFVFAERT